MIVEDMGASAQRSEWSGLEVRFGRNGRANHSDFIVAGRYEYVREPGRPCLSYGHRTTIALRTSSTIFSLPDDPGDPSRRNDNYVIEEITGPRGASVEIGGQNVKILRVQEGVRLFHKGKLAALKDRCLVILDGVHSNGGVKA